MPLAPYHWVHPPATLAPGNQAPDPAEAVLVPGPRGSPALEVSTQEGQAIVTFPAEAVATRADEPPVRVSVVPVDPSDLPEPPRGTAFDGNAYRASATYLNSNGGAPLLRPVT